MCHGDILTTSADGMKATWADDCVLFICMMWCAVILEQAKRFSWQFRMEAPSDWPCVKMFEIPFIRESTHADGDLFELLLLYATFLSAE